MNGELSKEQRRNIRRELGEVASTAIDRCLHATNEIAMQHRVLAKELVDHVARTDIDAKSMHQRLDAQGAWLQQVETALGALRGEYESTFHAAVTDVSQLERDLTDLKRLVACHDVLVTAGFWRRLMWALFGRWPLPRRQAASGTSITVDATLDVREGDAVTVKGRG